MPFVRISRFDALDPLSRVRGLPGSLLGLLSVFSSDLCCPGCNLGVGANWLEASASGTSLWLSLISDLALGNLEISSVVKALACPLVGSTAQATKLGDRPLIAAGFLIRCCSGAIEICDTLIIG